MASALDRLSAAVVRCRACPRLVAWREEVARVRRRAYREQRYWGRPVPGFGDPAARLILVGLAPGAHGANRTGRMFTGDRSGAFLYAALHRAGLASQPVSHSRDDGLRLEGAWITAACRCAPPGNAPTPAELERCAPFLARELGLLGEARVWVALGAVAWAAALKELARAGHPLPRPRPRFGHGAELRLEGGARAPRLLPPLPAEHPDRPAHPGDARRRPRPRPGAGRVAGPRAAGRPLGTRRDPGPGRATVHPRVPAAPGQRHGAC